MKKLMEKDKARNCGLRLTEKDNAKLEKLAKESGMSKQKVFEKMLHSTKSVQVRLETEE